MRVLIQRVAGASVEINGRIMANIHKGLLVFVGIEEADADEDIQWLTKKIVKLRIFNNDNGLMDFSVKEVFGEILVISQFTLHASTKKGNRPSYINAARPELAINLYDNFLNQLTSDFEKPVESGIFGADMKIALVNDGPVTIWLDSRNKG